MNLGSHGVSQPIIGPLELNTGCPNGMDLTDLLDFQEVGVISNKNSLMRVEFHQQLLIIASSGMLVTLNKNYPKWKLLLGRRLSFSILIFMNQPSSLGKRFVLAFLPVTYSILMKDSIKTNDVSLMRMCGWILS